MRSALGQRVMVLLALFAVLTAGGNHWLVLQSAAWVGMFVRFAQEDSVGEALEKTFDGKHPCPLCRKVQEGRSQDRQGPAALLLERVPDFLWSRNPLGAPKVSSNCGRAVFHNPFHSSYRVAPIKPPPKVLPTSHVLTPA